MKHPSPSLTTFAVGALLLTGLSRPACARDPDVEWFAHDKENAWLHNYDPTLISPRLVTELNYQDLDSDRSLLKLETTLRYGFLLRNGLGFGVQVMVPLETWHDSETSDDPTAPEGPETEGGFGDLQARTGIVGRISPTLRYGFGVNVKFDTASEPELGGNAFVLRPTTAIRWDVTDRLNVGFQAEYSFTPWGEGSDDVSALELKFPLAFKLTDTWSGALTYKPRWDLLAEDDRHRLAVGASHSWGSEHQYSLSFSAEVPLASDSLDWKFISGFAWYF